jgi:hypothetical protein
MSPNAIYRQELDKQGSGVSTLTTATLTRDSGLTTIVVCIAYTGDYISNPVTNVTFNGIACLFYVAQSSTLLNVATEMWLFGGNDLSGTIFVDWGGATITNASIIVVELSNSWWARNPETVGSTAGFSSTMSNTDTAGGASWTNPKFTILPDQSGWVASGVVSQGASDLVGPITLTLDTSAGASQVAKIEAESSSSDTNAFWHQVAFIPATAGPDTITTAIKAGGIAAKRDWAEAMIEFTGVYEVGIIGGGQCVPFIR